jgi:hypothetical protein
MTREELAALAQALAEAASPRLPAGVVIAVIATDETGAFVGVGSNCGNKHYQDALVACAAHGEDRIDHVRSVNPSLCECGHSPDVHFDDSDGMIIDGPCQNGRWTGVPCHCEGFTARNG